MASIPDNGSRATPPAPSSPPSLAERLAALPDEGWAPPFLRAAMAAASSRGAALLADGTPLASEGAIPDHAPPPDDCHPLPPSPWRLWLPGATSAPEGALLALGGLRAALAESRQQAERDQRASHHFLSVVNHDLKGPLAGIKAISDLIGWRIARGRLDPETEEGRADLTQRLTTLGQRVVQMAALIDELGEFSVIARGRLQLEVARHDLDDLVRASAARAESDYERPITLELPSRSLTVQADARRLGILLTALLKNAALYSPAESPILLTLAREPEGALIRVRDRGRGIEAEQQRRLFHEYGRSVQTGGSGLGIGLYMAHAIARAHGGSLTLDSSPGVGTTATLTLPTD